MKYRYGYVIEKSSKGNTLFKRVARVPIKRAPPPPKKEEEVLYECQQCGVFHMESRLLLCDYPRQNKTCDRMICLKCAGYKSVPEGDFYCKKCLKKEKR